jgi:nucleotide-binding universal stress UspA family protein
VLDDALQTHKAQRGETAALETQVGPSLDAAETPLQTLQRYVEGADVDLVVVDRPSDRGPVPPLAAATTKDVVERLDRPTLVVGGSEREEIRRILVATDLSDRSFDALRHATALAATYGAGVDLLHVIDTSPYVALTPTDRLSLGRTTLPERQARRRLRHFLQEGRLADVPIDTRLAFGEPADQVARVVNEGTVDLLVLASHGASARPERPLGRVADRVLRRVTCPVFLVRAFGRSLLPEGTASDPPSNAETEGM